MSNSFASMSASAQAAATSCPQRRERRQGLLELLASLSGFALVAAIWYGLNTVTKLSTLDMAMLIAN